MAAVQLREVSHPVPEQDLDDQQQLILSDLINRVLDKGVVIHSHIMISIADIDLIQLDLRLLISSVATMTRRAEAAARGDVSIRPGTGE